MAHRVRYHLFSLLPRHILTIALPHGFVSLAPIAKPDWYPTPKEPRRECNKQATAYY